jgi:hypothetical protein
MLKYSYECLLLLNNSNTEHSLSSGDRIENYLGAACSAHGGGERGIRGFVGKPEGKRPFGRPRSRWEDNIKMGLQEVGYGGMDWIELAQDRDRWRAFVIVVMNLRFP